MDDNNQYNNNRGDYSAPEQTDDSVYQTDTTQAASNATENSASAASNAAMSLFIGTYLFLISGNASIHVHPVTGQALWVFPMFFRPESIARPPSICYDNRVLSLYTGGLSP